MNTFDNQDPYAVTLDDGRSISAAAASLDDPFGGHPEGLLLVECVTLNPKAVLLCQGQTFKKATRILDEVLRTQDQVERGLIKRGKKEKPQPEERPVAWDADTGEWEAETVAETADLPTTTVDDLEPVDPLGETADLPTTTVDDLESVDPEGEETGFWDDETWANV
jgi:hypothetical protein